MHPNEDRKAIVQWARHDFTAFYSKATRVDAELMDSLVIGVAAVTAWMNLPRHHAGSAMRMELERKTNAVEQVFAANREAVRACPTFLLLSAGERRTIEREIFQVCAPVLR